MSEQQQTEEKNLIDVQEIVRRSENPHPITLILIIVMTVLIMYCVYVKVIKKSATGSWMDDAENSHHITHDLWKDTLTVDGKHYGIIKGHTMIVYMKDQMRMGIWVNDRISWTDGQTWMCEEGQE